MEFVEVLLQISLALIMFTIGLSLQKQDFKKTFKKPKPLSVGIISQIIFLPALALLIIQFFEISVGIKMGILILSISPGGTTSNLISYLVKGDTPLSVSMTAVNTIIIMFSVPVLLSAFIGLFHGSLGEASLSHWSLIYNLIFVLAIPVIAGTILNERRPLMSKKIEKYLKFLSIGFLALVFIIRIFAGESQGGSGITFDSALFMLPVLLVFHVAALFMGFFNSKIMGINNKSSITIGIEVGLQNTGLALLIAGNILGDDLALQPIIVYGLFSFFTTALFGVLMKVGLVKKNKNA